MSAEVRPSPRTDYPITEEMISNTQYLATFRGEEKEKEKEKTPQELLTKYGVEINFKSEGCVIHVGCRQFAYSSIKKAMKALNKYVKNPAIYHEQWDN